MQSTIKAFR